MKPLIYSLFLSAIFVTSGCKQALTPDSTTTTSGGSVFFTNGQAASTVIGQSSFTTNVSAVSSTGMSAPVGVGMSSGTLLYVVDQNNNRVLGYNSVPTSNGAAADFVIGQTSFIGATSGSSASQLAVPMGVSVSGLQLFVSDFSNHRMLIYNGAFSTGLSASVAVGQLSTSLGTDPGVTPSATTMRFPQNVCAAGSKFAVADGNFNRVLLYNSIPSSSGVAADVVLGQSNKTSSVQGVANMYTPTAVWTDGTKIAVADGNNHRVLIWNSWPTVDGTAPSLVLGQPNFTSSTANNGGISASTLFSPYGVTSNGTELLVSDRANNRVLYWSTWPTTNQQAADVVLGQANFTTNTATGANITSLWSPRGLYLNGSTLIVADSNNNRVVVYQKQ